MKSLFDYLKEDPEYSSLATTYQVGLLQTRAYKAVMGRTSEFLSKLKISNSDWVALGIIFEHSKGLRSLELARIMSVNQAYITVVVDKLVKRGYLIVSPDSTDKRAKILHLSTAGKLFVKKTEELLSKEMIILSSGISIDDALSYFKVQKHIIQQSKTKKS